MLGYANLGTPNTNTLIYTVPAAATRAAVSVFACNRNGAGQVAAVRIAWARVGLPPDPGGDTALEWDTPVAPGAPLERTGIVLLTGQSIYAQTDTPGVSVSLCGIEEIPVAVSTQSTGNTIDAGSA